MLPFEVHHLHVAGRHYLLLPKLNTKQMEVLMRRFESKGFSVHLTTILSGRSGGQSVHVDPTGLCWSSADPEDAVLPAIPEVLSCPKEEVPLEELEALYFIMRRSGEYPLAKMLTRMESGSLWDSLRASGECGLTPDERSVALALMDTGEKCRLVTDFVEEESAARVFGRRRYFEASIDFEEAKSTLRMVGERAPRDAYLPRDGALRLGEGRSLSRFQGIFEGLGEWCFFTPKARKL